MPDKQEYKRLKQLGICVHCGKAKAVKGKTMCLDCLDTWPEKEWSRSEASKAQRREYMKRKRDLCVALGICRECLCREATHGLKCEKCYYKGKVKYKSKRELYEACGLCTLCGGVNVEGYKVCSRCLEKCRNMVKNRKHADNSGHYWRKVQHGEVTAIRTWHKKRS